MIDESEALKQMSRLAFGQDYRLPLLLAVASRRNGRHTQTSLARALGVSTSSIQKSFKDVVELGLLEPKFEEGQRNKFHEASDSALWSWVEELADRVSARSVTKRRSQRPPKAAP